MSLDHQDPESLVPHENEFIGLAVRTLYKLGVHTVRIVFCPADKVHLIMDSDHNEAFCWECEELIPYE